MGISLKNGGHSWLFLCCFLVLLALAECAYDPAHVLNCTYMVEVQTLCPKEAATTRPVYIRFGDKGGNEVIVRPLNSKFLRRIKPKMEADTPNNNTSLKPFQACTIDEYQVKAVCIATKVCYMFLKLMEEKDDWKVGTVQIKSIDGPKTKILLEHALMKNVPHKAWNGVDNCGLEDGISSITKAKNILKRLFRVTRKFFKRNRTHGRK